MSKSDDKPKASKVQPRVAIRNALNANKAFYIDLGSGKRLHGPASETNPFRLTPFTLTDDTINTICLDLAEAKVANSRPMVEQVICSNQVSKPINLPMAQLNHLEACYDGKDYVAELIDCCNTDSPELFAAMFKKWLVSVVAQVFDIGRRNEYAFVFVGAQNCGKTGFFERLLWHRQHYVAPATAFTFSNKEHMLLLTSHVLILLDEMSAYGKKTDLDQLKAAFSLSEVTTDKKYQEAGTYPRRGSFGGTTNKPDFLRDVTGDRRFWVFELASYDQPRFNAIDKMQLWGQLTRLYKEGFVTRMTDAETKANIKRNQVSYSMEKVEDYFIEDNFVVTKNPDHFVSNRAMYLLIDGYNKNLASKTFGISRTTVAAILKQQGVLANMQGRDKGAGNKNSRGYQGLQMKTDWQREEDDRIKREANEKATWADDVKETKAAADAPVAFLEDQDAAAYKASPATFPAFYDPESMKQDGQAEERAKHLADRAAEMDEAAALARVEADRKAEQAQYAARYAKEAEATAKRRAAEKVAEKAAEKAAQQENENSDIDDVVI
ncbi:VapE domain-containing protein [Hymenobacter sp. UV11]|uniref:VapE domain-containing protein n=1 Tax=Hymenobacter sp. UV11 TaxID=1849735 RepID=UPI0010F2776A|nr:VapE domain-containing protein [Hymenobacter sp. UV11]TDN38584.1 hypothetical protein A8B98_22835 [Hymenobacter sp. UV11]